MTRILHTYGAPGAENIHGPVVYTLHRDGVENPRTSLDIVYVAVLDGPQNLAERMSDHKEQGLLFDRWDVQEFDTLPQCEFVEEMLVRNFQPEYNAR
jgi:hypothetical protein